MKLPKGVTYNKAKNRYKVVYRSIFVGYYTSLVDAKDTLELMSVKYLQEQEKMLNNMNKFAKILREGE